MVLHQTVGANRIRSHSARHGSHRLARSHGNISTFMSSSSSTSAASVPPSTFSRSTVSSYLEILPSLALSDTPPPRPPRPPGGLLGISNGRGIGYGRSLGSSYDSPLTIHGSFNGHVRSGANLFGGKNQSSGISPTRSSSGYHRPSLSVFPIQKALEIAMKESRLLQAASSRGGLGPSGSGRSLDSYWRNNRMQVFSVNALQQRHMEIANLSENLGNTARRNTINRPTVSSRPCLHPCPRDDDLAMQSLHQSSHPVQDISN